MDYDDVDAVHICRAHWELEFDLETLDPGRPAKPTLGTSRLGTRRITAAVRQQRRTAQRVAASQPLFPWHLPQCNRNSGLHFTKQRMQCRTCWTTARPCAATISLAKEQGLKPVKQQPEKQGSRAVRTCRREPLGSEQLGWLIIKTLIKTAATVVDELEYGALHADGSAASAAHRPGLLV